MENYGILLVDDEPAYHAIVSALLLPHYGTIDCAADRRAALQAVRRKSYDLILLDIEMAEGDGYRTVTEIRAAREWARVVPIVAFTTLHPPAGDRHFIEEGFDGWLPKPFSAAQLIGLLRRWLGTDQIGAIDRPGVKLAEILGEDASAAMTERLFASFAEAIAAIDGGAAPRGYGHRLGGLAGTLGFAVLSAAWLGLQYGDSASWPTVRALTTEAIDQYRAGRRARVSETPP